MIWYNCKSNETVCHITSAPIKEHDFNYIQSIVKFFMRNQIKILIIKTFEKLSTSKEKTRHLVQTISPFLTITGIIEKLFNNLQMIVFINRTLQHTGFFSTDAGIFSLDSAFRNFLFRSSFSPSLLISLLLLSSFFAAAVGTATVVSFSATATRKGE